MQWYGGLLTIRTKGGFINSIRSDGEFMNESTNILFTLKIVKCKKGSTRRGVQITNNRGAEKRGIPMAILL